MKRTKTVQRQEKTFTRGKCSHATEAILAALYRNGRTQYKTMTPSAGARRMRVARWLSFALAGAEACGSCSSPSSRSPFTQFFFPFLRRFVWHRSLRLLPRSVPASGYGVRRIFMTAMFRCARRTIGFSSSKNTESYGGCMRDAGGFFCGSIRQFHFGSFFRRAAEGIRAGQV